MNTISCALYALTLGMSILASMHIILLVSIRIETQ